MVFRSYNTNSLGVFKTPYQDRDEDSSVLAESGSVCSDPIDKRVRFAKRVVFLDELVGGNCCCPSMLAMEDWGKNCGTARYMATLWRERHRNCPCECCSWQVQFWFDLGYFWSWDEYWSPKYSKNNEIWEWNLLRQDGKPGVKYPMTA